MVRVPKYYDEYKRDEFQVFGYEADIHEPEEFKSPRAFLEFLGLQKFRFPKKSYNFTLSNFIDEANAMATALKEVLRGNWDHDRCEPTSTKCSQESSRVVCRP